MHQKVAQSQPPSPELLVWDLPLRLVHWAIALCFAGSWITAEAGFEWTELHFRLGYTTLGLVLFRVVWGFVGPTHARFLNFVRGPAAILSYLRGTSSASVTQSYPGHNPLGALSVLALLTALLFQATSGLFISDDIFYAGPYNPVVSSATAGQLANLHHLNFRLLQCLVALHLLAIGWYYWRRKQNLVKPMLTGRKRIPHAAAIQHSQLVKALCVAAAVVAFVAWLLLTAPPAPIADYY